jgi:hypothetical protein
VYVGTAKSSVGEPGQYAYYPNAELAHGDFGSRLILDMCSSGQPAIVVARYGSVAETLVLATNPRDLLNPVELPTSDDENQVKRIVKLDQPINWVTGAEKELFETAFGEK